MKKTIAILSITLALLALTSCASKQEAKYTGPKRNVGFLGVVGREVAEDIVKSVNDGVLAELNACGKFVVVDRNKMQSDLGDQEKALKLDSGKDMAQIGKMLNVHHMVKGTCYKLGPTHYISVELMNVETSQIEQTATEKFSDVKDIPSAVRSLVSKL